MGKTIVRPEPKTHDEIIASFMGRKCRMFQVFSDQPEEVIWFNEGEDDFVGHYVRTAELEYSYSWEALMPVVEKIESLGYDTGICGVVINGEKLTEVLFSPIKKVDGSIEIHQRTAGDKLKVLYEAIVLFIRTYNLQNQTSL